MSCRVNRRAARRLRASIYRRCYRTERNSPHLIAPRHAQPSRRCVTTRPSVVIAPRRSPVRVRLHSRKSCKFDGGTSVDCAGVGGSSIYALPNLRPPQLAASTASTSSEGRGDGVRVHKLNDDEEKGEEQKCSISNQFPERVRGGRDPSRARSGKGHDEPENRFVPVAC
jgi:hypothetical protein